MQTLQPFWTDLQNSQKGVKPVDGSTFIFTMRVILKTEIYLTVAMKM
jgi:hypothetical protein